MHSDWRNWSVEKIQSRVPGRCCLLQVIFDSDGLVFDGHSIRHAEGIGWIVLYKGLRWEQRGAQKTTQVGYGFLILDDTVPEKYCIVLPNRFRAG